MKNIIAAVTLLTLAGSAYATAIDIPMSAKKGPALMNGDGLNGKGWNAGATDLPWLRMKVGTNANWTFMDGRVHSPNETDGVTGAWPGLVKDFFGTDASMYTGGNTKMAKDVTMQWKGYISIKDAGMFTMGAYGDGLFEIKLGGQTILSKGADGTGGDTQSVWVSMAGMYQIEINYSNPAGAAGINLLWSRPGDGKLTASSVPAAYRNLNIISQGSLFKAVPTPSAAALMGMGALAIGRRRR